MEYRKKKDHSETATGKIKRQKEKPEYRKPELMRLEDEIEWSRGGVCESPFPAP
jgi:hypothetical protein